MINPSVNLCWLDLSFNQLTTIDEVFTQFANLKTLYLHSNKVEKVEEVAKLGSVSSSSVRSFQRAAELAIFLV
jgi:Leucine-rich repeat (LRR) protein